MDLIKHFSKEKLVNRKVKPIYSGVCANIVEHLLAIEKKTNRKVNRTDLVIVSKSIIKILSNSLDQIPDQTSLAVQYKEEIELYMEYLPTMIEESVIVSFVRGTINKIPKEEISMKLIGTINKAIKEKYGEAVDMKLASYIIKKEILAISI